MLPCERVNLESKYDISTRGRTRKDSSSSMLGALYCSKCRLDTYIQRMYKRITITTQVQLNNCIEEE